MIGRRIRRAIGRVLLWFIREAEPRIHVRIDARRLTAARPCGPIRMDARDTGNRFIGVDVRPELPELPDA